MKKFNSNNEYDEGLMRFIFILVGLLLILILLVSTTACKCKKEIQSSLITTEKEIIRHKIVYAHDTITLPGSESKGEAFFECDSLNRVQLRSLALLESEKLRLQAKFDILTGKFNFLANLPPDTVYVEIPVLVSDTTIEKKMVEKESSVIYTNKLKGWQKSFIGLGIFSLLFSIIQITRIMKK